MMRGERINAWAAGCQSVRQPTQQLGRLNRITPVRDVITSCDPADGNLIRIRTLDIDGAACIDTNFDSLGEMVTANADAIAEAVRLNTSRVPASAETGSRRARWRGR